MQTFAVMMRRAAGLCSALELQRSWYSAFSRFSQFNFPPKPMQRTRGGAAPSSFAAPAAKAAIDRILRKKRDRLLRGGHLGSGGTDVHLRGGRVCGTTPLQTSMRRPRAHVAPAVVDEGLTPRCRPRFPRLAESVFKRTPSSPAAASPVRQNRGKQPPVE
jgi:hypothetical protein